MVTHPLASIVLRPRRGLPLLVVLVIVIAVIGCGHRRNALRPVYVTPAPAAVAAPVVEPVPAPGCEAPAPVGSGPVLEAPVSGPTQSTPPPPGPGMAAPAGSGSAGGTGEPPLESPTNSPPPPMNERIPKATPDASFNDGLRSPSVRLRQASLRESLRPYVNNPDDLFAPPKADRPWKYIVLHHSASASGGYDQIDREHRKVLGFEGCGYHFIIGNGTGSPDGQVEVAMRWTNQKNGVHCRNAKLSEINEYGIGICLVGDLDDKPPTARQIAATRALVAYLESRYSIPVTHVGTHEALASSPTACPGKYFPVQAILSSRAFVQR